MQNEESDAGIAFGKLKRIMLKATLISSLVVISTPPRIMYASTIYVKKEIKEIKAKVSWYGGRFNGRKTANGERYCKDSMTCAHNTLPFNSIVKIKYNNKIIKVRVNDRGNLYGRDFDLSEKAAERLGIMECGVATVKVLK